MIDKTISHYKIIEKLSVGGMGEVYLAEDTHLDRKVALKFLPHYTTDSRNQSTIKREAKAAAALNHPYIITNCFQNKLDERILEYLINLYL